MDAFSLKGAGAIVSGASRGLGRSMAEALLEAGAQVLFLDILPEVAQTAEEYSAKGFPAKSFTLDMSDRNAIQASFEEILSLLDGRVDILVNNAGIQRRSPFLEFPLDYWDDVLKVNLESIFVFSQLAAREMAKNGKGRIINIASMNSLFGGMNIAAYSAAKSGVAGLTKAMSNELAGKGINVNAIAPGYMDTEMNQIMRNEKTAQPILDRIPKGRWGSPDDLKGLVVFLASPASDYISGALIPVDGGFAAR
ncbi:MAG: SDR family oxidoreductase [Treponema sp.]|nr:SDR family oxidoreductase [Treponema sp.]